MRYERLALFAEDHHGLLTRDVALRAGLSRSAWYRAADAHEIEIVHPGVARLVGAPRTIEQAIAAAVFAAGPRSMASHRSGARLWGVPRPDDEPIDVLIPTRSRRGLELDGVVVHHPRDQLDLKLVLRHNIPTTNVLRLLCDLGAVDPPGVPAAVGHFVALGTVSPVALQRALQRHARRGRHGIGALRAALDDWVIDGKPADSVLEPAMHRILTTNDLPPAAFHARLAGFEVDFWLIDTPIVLECDGWDHHARTRQQFARDTERRAALVAAGYVTIGFTYHEIIKRPQRVARRIQQAVTTWT